MANALCLKNHKLSVHCDTLSHYDKLQCHTCHIDFANPENLEFHNILAHPRLKQKCPYCGQVKKNLTRHLKLNKVFKDPEFKCDRCDLMTHFEPCLAGHTRAVHNTKKMVIKCSKCNIHFVDFARLQDHVTIMHAKMPHVPIESQQMSQVMSLSQMSQVTPEMPASQVSQLRVFATKSEPIPVFATKSEPIPTPGWRVTEESPRVTQVTKLSPEESLHVKQEVTEFESKESSQVTSVTDLSPSESLGCHFMDVSPKVTKLSPEESQHLTKASQKKVTQVTKLSHKKSPLVTKPSIMKASQVKKASLRCYGCEGNENVSTKTKMCEVCGVVFGCIVVVAKI